MLALQHGGASTFASPLSLSLSRELNSPRIIKSYKEKKNQWRNKKQKEKWHISPLISCC